MNSALALLQYYNADSDEEIDCEININERKRSSDDFSLPNSKRSRTNGIPEYMDLDDSQTVNITNGKESCLGCNDVGQEILKFPEISTHRAIPLPQEYLTQPVHIDDSNLHDGRTRSFAHDRGNWASYAYVPLSFGTNEPYMKSLLASMKAVCQENNLGFTAMNDFHISVSKTVVLRMHWIQPIVDDLKKIFCTLPSSYVWLSKLSVYVNDERTRTFLGLEVQYGCGELQEIVDVVDNCFHEYKLPKFYKNPSFHVSIGWCNGNLKKEFEKIVPSLEGVLSHYFEIENEMRSFTINNICFKTGNRVHLLSLKALQLTPINR